MKQNKYFWRKLGQDFTAHAANSDWNKPRSIKLSHTALFPSHAVGRGPNSGETTLLDFSTRLTEASAIHFHFENKYNALQIYVNSSAKSADQIFFEVRKNNKNYDFVYLTRTDLEDQSYFVKNLMKAVSPDTYLDENTIAEQLTLQGYSVVVSFPFNDQVKFRLSHHGGGTFISPKYVKQFKNGIEIGWVSSGTYNALPNVIRIEKCREVKRVKLADLGLETAGYYSHHYHCEIQPSQANEAKKFFKGRFKK